MGESTKSSQQLEIEKWWELRNKAKNASGFMKKVHTRKYNKMMRRFQSFIPLKAQFKGMPVFPHGISGIFISNGAVIGENCVIFHQVTIGSNNLNDSKGKGAPVLGDNVYIGCGAKIIGAVNVGDNARIGANCTVVKDVPANSTVVPAAVRIIAHEEEQDNRFVKWNGGNQEQ